VPPVPTRAQSSEFLISSVPERYMEPCPWYVLTAPFCTWALPSMKTVPRTVRTRVSAFQESSPPAVLQL
jgi:hypothetical protein